MSNGLIFNKRHNTADNWSNILHYIISDDGVINGCGIKFTENQISIEEGYFILKGRAIQIQREKKITVEPAITNGFLRLRYRINLNNVPSAELFTQGDFELDYSDNLDFSKLIQEDIRKDGKIYEIEFALLEISGRSLRTVVRRLPEIVMNSGKLEHNTLDEILLKIYPIGAIYMSANSTNPSNIIGGKWVAWGSGRVPVGVDPAQEEFNVVEKTGGAKFHQLQAGHIPRIDILIQGSNVLFGDKLNGSYRAVNIANAGSTTYTDKASRNRTDLYNAGGELGTAYRILQPYITCYMWKRTE